MSTLTPYPALSSMRLKGGFWMVDFTFLWFLKPRSIQPSQTCRFRMCRADRTKGGGGLMVYIRSNFCFKVIKDLPNLPFSERAEYKTESIVLKITIGKPWETILGIYNRGNL